MSFFIIHPAVDCGPPPQPDNTVPSNFTTTMYESVVTYTCAGGYSYSVPSPVTSIECGVDSTNEILGQWQDTPTECLSKIITDLLCVF